MNPKDQLGNKLHRKLELTLKKGGYLQKENTRVDKRLVIENAATIDLESASR